MPGDSGITILLIGNLFFVPFYLNLKTNVIENTTSVFYFIPLKQ